MAAFIRSRIDDCDEYLKSKNDSDDVTDNEPGITKPRVDDFSGIQKLGADQKPCTFDRLEKENWNNLAFH
jgi:hypothetical protein